MKKVKEAKNKQNSDFIHFHSLLVLCAELHQKIISIYFMDVMASNFKVLENQGNSNVNDHGVKKRWKWK